MMTDKHLNGYKSILAGLKTGHGFLGFAAYLHSNGHELIISKLGPSVIFNGCELSVKGCGLMPAFIAMMEQAEGTTPRFAEGSPTAAILEARLTWITCSKFSEDIPEENAALGLYLKWLQPSFVDKIITELFWAMGHTPKATRVQCLQQLLQPAVNFALVAFDAQRRAPVAAKKPKRKRRLTPFEKLDRLSRLLEEL